MRMSRLVRAEVDYDQWVRHPSDYRVNTFYYVPGDLESKANARVKAEELQRKNPDNYYIVGYGLDYFDVFDSTIWNTRKEEGSAKLLNRRVRSDYEQNKDFWVNWLEKQYGHLFDEETAEEASEEIITQNQQWAINVGVSNQEFRFFGEKNELLFCVLQEELWNLLKNGFCVTDNPDGQLSVNKNPEQMLFGIDRYLAELGSETILVPGSLVDWCQKKLSFRTSKQKPSSLFIQSKV